MPPAFLMLKYDNKQHELIQKRWFKVAYAF